MNFILSYRLNRPFYKPRRLKAVKVQHEYRRRTPWLNFILLSVDNSTWIFLQMLAAFLRFIISTYIISFIRGNHVSVGVTIINAILDIFCAVDLFSAILYRTRWPRDRKALNETSPQLSRIVWRNAQFGPRALWMIIFDILSLLPLEYISMWVEFYLPIKIITCILPSLRIYKLILYYVDDSKRISLKGHVLVRLFFKVGIFWLLGTHTLTCLMHWIAYFEGDYNTQGLSDNIMIETYYHFEVYLVIFYFVQVGFSNIGFGDIVPKTDVERVFTLMIVVAGFIMLCGYLIAALSTVLEVEARRLTHLRHRVTLMDFELIGNGKKTRQNVAAGLVTLSNLISLVSRDEILSGYSNSFGKVKTTWRKVPESVSKKILKFYYSLWVGRKGVGFTNDLLNTLPHSLASSVYYDIFSPALNASLLFMSCDEFSKRAISELMEISLYMSGDVILKRNEINTKMFYIRKGAIEIMSYQDDETQIMTFGSGTVFGQFSLLLSLPAKSEIHAATFCEIHTISRRNLFMVLSDYPKAKEIVLNVHKNMLINVLADKFHTGSSKIKDPPENVLTESDFYKIPFESSKLARDDICIVNTFPYVFVPDTIFLKVWSAFLAIIIVVICFFYPYCAAFQRMYPLNLEPFVILVDILLFFNLYLSFTTAIVKENILFYNLRDIATSKIVRLSTYFDVLSIMPVHYFLDNRNRLKPVLLCLRCLQFYKVQLLFRTAEYNVDMTMIGALRTVKYVLYFLFGAYAMGMVYYLEACYYYPCTSSSWYNKSEITQKVDSPIWISLYFAIVVMSGTGYGDLTIGDVTDIGYAICFIIIGVLLYIYLISEYSANLSLAREPRQNFRELAERVNSFLVSHKMLSSERIRVRQFLNLQWERNMGYEFTSNHDLFYDTPDHILFQASQYTRSRGIQNMELFRGLGSSIPSNVLSHSTKKVLPPHEVVVYAGEVISSLLVVEEGCCEATYGKDISVKKILNAGDSICVVELMLGLTALCHVRTLTHCTILAVQKEHLHRAFALNPIVATELNTSIVQFKKSSIVNEVQKTRPIRLHLTVRSTIQNSLYRFRYYRKQGGNQELRDPYLKLGLCQWIRYILRSTTVLPYGKLLKQWELSRSVFAFFSAMIFPLLPFYMLEFPLVYYMALFLDMTAWIDLYFRLHVCYYNNKKLLVSHPLWTCGHYIKGSFVLDFIFCFPFDRIMYRPVFNADGEALVTDVSIDVLRLFRVGQVYRLPSYVRNLGIDYLSNANLFWVLVMMTAMTLVYLNFLTSILVLGCFNYKVNREGEYHLIIRPSVREHFIEALEKFGFDSHPSLLILLAFYWISVTSFGLGLGDITAGTRELMIFVIFVLVFSYLYFNYVTIIIASYLSSINMNLTIFQKRMNHLIKYLKKENVEPILRQHIINHFEYEWKKSKGMKGQLVFHNFNLALRHDVMLHLYEETLKGVAAFKKLDPSFLRVLSSRLDEINFQIGAAIYKSEDIISELFIIHQGEVTLVGEDEEHTEVLSRSMFFGHLENVSRGRGKESAVATKNVTVLSIQTTALYRLLIDFYAVIEDRGRQGIFRLRMPSSESAGNISAQDEDIPKYVTQQKNKSWLVQTTYKFSKHILILYVVLSLESANHVAYVLGFQNHQWFLMFLVMPIELLFIFKIFLGFNTGYIDEAGNLVFDPRRIKARYMRLTGFYLDFFTVVPFEILAFAAKPEDWYYISSWLRVTKLFRLYNVWYFFNLKFDTLNVNMVMLKIIAIAVWTGTLLHQCTCVWYLVSCPRANCPESRTWNDLEEKGFDNKYLACIYFIIVVITTTGYGDVAPITVPEILCVIVLMFISFFYTAIFIGQMVSTAQKSLFAKINYEFQVKGLKTFFDVNEVSYDVQQDILRYVDHLWRNEKGQQIPELLQSAPPYLTQEIKLSTYGHHINLNPVFRNCDPRFRKQLTNFLTRTVFYPGDVIVYQGMVDRTAYFVHAGLVESKDLIRKKPKKIYKQGTYFGLKQGVMDRVPHSKTFYAMTMCVILSLRLRDWSFLQEFYPEDIKYIHKQIREEFD